MTTIMAPSSRRQLPRAASVVAAVLALATALLSGLLLGWGAVATATVALILFNVLLPLWSRSVEGPRAALNRLVIGLAWSILLVALAPLLWLLWEVVQKGAPAVSWSFLTHDAAPKLNPVTYRLEPGAGVLHALVGTLLVTFGATVVSVPIGVMAAIYLVEYGNAGRRRLARALTLLVDVMTGIPSIVAGLFALSLFSVFFGVGTRSGIMGSIALSLLMVPTVVRSTEEMIRLVPNDLREAAFALGVPRWRTIVKVVLPTSAGGIVTGVMLSISRVIGETAPLLVAVGSIDVLKTSLFDGRIETLPVYIMDQYRTSTPDGYRNAWGAALLLIVIVMLLNLIARVVGKLLAPKTGK